MEIAKIDFSKTTEEIKKDLINVFFQNLHIYNLTYLDIIDICTLSLTVTLTLLDKNGYEYAKLNLVLESLKQE